MQLNSLEGKMQIRPGGGSLHTELCLPPGFYKQDKTDPQKADSTLFTVQKVIRQKVKKKSSPTRKKARVSSKSSTKIIRPKAMLECWKEVHPKKGNESCPFKNDGSEKKKAT